MNNYQVLNLSTYEHVNTLCEVLHEAMIAADREMKSASKREVARLNLTHTTPAHIGRVVVLFVAGDLAALAANAEKVNRVTFQYSTGNGTKWRRVEAKEVALNKREASPTSTSQPTAPQQPLRTELPSAGKRKRICTDQRTQVDNFISLLFIFYM